MTDFLRKRALDNIDYDQWKSYNPLFLSAISDFDEAFDRGVLLDLSYYVPRTPIKSKSFENDLLEVLFSVHAAPKTKIYTLVGSVGTGKTSTCRYIQENIQMKVQELLVIRVDVWPIEEYDFDDFSKLNQLLLEATYNSLKRKGVVKSRIELYKLLLLSMGFEENELSANTILNYENRFQFRHIIDLFENIGFTKILLIFDNIDESSLDMIKACREFAMDIAILARSRNNSHNSVSILFPVREYTNHRHFYNQERFAHIDITVVDEAAILSKKISQVSNSIKKSAATYSQDIDYGKFSRKAKKHIIHAKKITIAQDSMAEFLKGLGEIILSTKEREFYNLVKEVSNGNLKILVGNTYNFLHSCKLPLTNLFLKIFVPNEYHYNKNIDNIASNLALECLMTIHYPFYDVKSSHIINLFNVLNSTTPNDYKNTLINIRLLCYLKNKGECHLDYLISQLVNVGYHKKYISYSINKLFEYGLIKSDHGCCIEYLNDSSHIGVSDAGIFYLESIIKTTNYLQLVCEDTPMCTQYIIPIENKYNIDEDQSRTTNLLANRLDSITLFLDFLQDEEDLEKKYIVDELCLDWNEYLYSFSYIENNKGVTISSVLKQAWNNEQHKITMVSS